jgi:hypothetical protein
MQPGSAYYFAQQHCLILRRQARASGMTDDEITALLRRGEWVAVRRGVYTTGLYWEALDPYVGRPRLEVWAALLIKQTPQIASHDSAAYLQELDILEAQPRLVHITRHGALGGRTRHGVKHHKAPMRPDQIVFVDEQAVLDIPRTVADIAREHGLRHGVVAAGSALRAGVSRHALRAAVEPMRCWPNVTLARRSVEWADGRCESPGEDLTLLMLKQLGIDDVEPQFGLQEDGRIAWADFRIRRHLVEFDGHMKFRPVQEGGLATRPPDEVLWMEKKRQDWMCGFKLGMSRLTWVDVQPDNWCQTQARLLREILATDALFGTSIDDLAPYRVRRPRR